MSRAASYIRQKGEYVRPAVRLLLMSADPFDAWARGVVFHAGAFAGKKPGQLVEVELVPEPGNPHDSHAVALDHDGRRFGYLSSFIADTWHDIVRAANTSGYSLWVRGRLQQFEDDDGAHHLSPTLLLPRFDEQRELAARFGLTNQAEALLSKFDSMKREEFLEASREEFPPNLERALRSHASNFPAFRWAPPNARRGRVPGVLNLLFRDIARRERLARADARREAAALARAKKEADRASARQVKAEALEQSRQHRLERAAAAEAAGMSNEELAASLGVSAATATGLKRQARGRAWDRNAEMRAERLERCASAVRLQDQGLTRAQIAVELSCGVETVANLLRDGRFFADPTSDSDRLDRAHDAARATASGLTRAQWRAARELSSAKAAEAWKDADVLDLSGGTEGQ